MNHQNKIPAGSIACTFVTLEDAEIAYNILMNRNYSTAEIHVLAPRDLTNTCSPDQIQLGNVFKNGEIVSGQIVISESLKIDLNSAEETVAEHLKACGISDLHAEKFESSLSEKEIIIIVYPHNETDRQVINEEFNFYKGKQLNGSEAYTV